MEHKGKSGVTGATSRKKGMRQEAKPGSGEGVALGKKTVSDCRYSSEVLELTPKTAITEERNHQGMKIQ